MEDAPSSERQRPGAEKMRPDPTQSDQPGAAWHLQDYEAVLAHFGADATQGLSAEQVEAQRARFGPNELVEHGIKSPWLILWEQFTDVMVIVLLVAAVISGLLGDYLDTIVIMAIVVLNAILGFTQEYRAEQAMAALKRMAAPHVRLRRDGHVVEVDAPEIVPGDIVLLEAGSVVPADARLLEAANLRVQEASLTGESVAVDKVTEALSARGQMAIGDRRNMVYLGTSVSYGRGVAVVTATGMSTELGRIAELIQTVESEKTPLQRRMAQLGKSLAVVAIALVTIVFVLGVIRGEGVATMFLTAVAMAVAAVPEGLPAVVTISLALGAQRMLKRNALIRKLPAVETLGSVTVICSDKTGTLTENRMTVKILDLAGQTIDLIEMIDQHRPERGTLDNPLALRDTTQTLLLTGGALCNDAVLEREEPDDGDYRTIGDPTEGALLVAAARFGLWKAKLETVLPRVGEVPFSSERKRMTTIHAFHPEAQANGSLIPLLNFFEKHPTPNIEFSKGAVDSLLNISDRVWVDGEIVPLTEDWRERITNTNNRLAQDGLRVLGIGFRPLETALSGEDEEAAEQQIVFVGMVGLLDPPRPEVKEAVATSKTAGIRPVMITGDHPLTALQIARELDIAEDDRILTGPDLSSMTIRELETAVNEVSVYARVSPEHKLNIVQALQKHGEIVAMTGDGVNDAPALRRGDIGVAMGITGTDVSKEAADMVLLDDNFATIVAAVEEGRTIYDNVRKFIKYTMTSNAGEIYVMLFAPFLGMPLPLTAIQILWINLVTDGLPGLALGVEPTERGTMRRKPFSQRESIFSRGMGRHILWVGLLMGLVSLGLGFWEWSTGNPHWQTMVFTTLTLSQMGHALAIRSGTDSLFRVGLFSNKALLGAVLLTFVLQMGVVYLPFLQPVFDTSPLSLRDLGISLLFSMIVFFAVELEKLLIRRGVLKVKEGVQ